MWKSSILQCSCSCLILLCLLLGVRNVRFNCGRLHQQSQEWGVAFKWEQAVAFQTQESKVSHASAVPVETQEWTESKVPNKSTVNDYVGVLKGAVQSVRLNYSPSSIVLFACFCACGKVRFYSARARARFYCACFWACETCDSTVAVSINNRRNGE